jgi:hypothetical protein
MAHAPGLSSAIPGVVNDTKLKQGERKCSGSDRDASTDSVGSNN